LRYSASGTSSVTASPRPEEAARGAWQPARPDAWRVRVRVRVEVGVGVRVRVRVRVRASEAGRLDGGRAEQRAVARVVGVEARARRLLGGHAHRLPHVGFRVRVRG